MSNITILKQDETESGWEFLVAIGGITFKVEVERTYWQEITDGNKDAEELVRRSFEFLLEREPKEAILRQFNLREIEKYFPEYPGGIFSKWR